MFLMSIFFQIIPKYLMLQIRIPIRIFGSKMNSKITWKTKFIMTARKKTRKKKKKEEEERGRGRNRKKRRKQKEGRRRRERKYDVKKRTDL